MPLAYHGGMASADTDRTLRIVLTGGPGGGKTTAADMLRREFDDRVALVPETATMLFTGGFPRVDEAQARRSAQTAIFHVQRNLEDVQTALYPRKILLCDRGTVDGAVYWPEDGDFFEAMGTTLEAELARYHHVIFFETAAVGGLSIASGNPARIETLNEALELDTELRKLWSKHPRFHFVPHGPSFLAKITSGLHSLTEILAGARYG